MVEESTHIAARVLFTRHV